MARIQSYALSSLNEGDKLLASDAVTGATKNVSPLDVADLNGGVKIYRAFITQTATAAPIATVVGPNTIGNITWVRNSVGSYNGNLTGAFSGYVAIVMGVAPTSEFPADMSYSNTSNGITLLTYNSNGGSLTDGMLTQQYIEIRVYQV
jgi:hypothetical protein